MSRAVENSIFSSKSNGNSLTNPFMKIDDFTSVYKIIVGFLNFSVSLNLIVVSCCRTLKFASLILFIASRLAG